MNSYCVVFITAPRGAFAKRMARHLLKKRLAACVNILPAVQSHYWWQGTLEAAEESMLIVKTRKRLLLNLIAAVRRLHPYTTPEIVALPIIGGHREYLSWVLKETSRQ